MDTSSDTTCPRGTGAIAVCLWLAVATFSGCAASPGRTTVGAATLLPKCAASVVFSGPPRVLTPDEVLRATANLSGIAGWSAEGSFFDSPVLAEIAICICREPAFAETELVAMADSIRREQHGGKGSSSAVEGLGQTYDFGPIVSERGLTERSRMVSLQGASSCFASLTVRELPSSAPSSFLARITPTKRADGSGIAARFEQLDQLLRDKLITRQEYDAARKKLLEQL